MNKPKLFFRRTKKEIRLGLTVKDAKEFREKKNPQEKMM